MALTESKLRSIIGEEARRVMGDGGEDEPEDFGAGAGGGYAEREKMDRDSEMGDDDDDGDGDVPAAVEEIVHMFRQGYHSMESLAADFSPRPGEVRFNDLRAAVERRAGGRYDQRDIEDAADAISLMIQDYTIARHRRYRDDRY